MNAPKHPGHGDAFQQQRARLAQLGVSHITIHLHIGVLKIVHNFWCKFLDFKYKVGTPVKLIPIIKSCFYIYVCLKLRDNILRHRDR